MVLHALRLVLLLIVSSAAAGRPRRSLEDGHSDCSQSSSCSDPSADQQTCWDDGVPTVWTGGNEGASKCLPFCKDTPCIGLNGNTEDHPTILVRPELQVDETGKEGEDKKKKPKVAFDSSVDTSPPLCPSASGAPSSSQLPTVCASSSASKGTFNTSLLDLSDDE